MDIVARNSRAQVLYMVYICNIRVITEGQLNFITENTVSESKQAKTTIQRFPMLETLSLKPIMHYIIYI